MARKASKLFSKKELTKEQDVVAQTLALRHDSVEVNLLPISGYANMICYDGGRQIVRHRIRPDGSCSQTMWTLEGAIS